MLLSVKFLKALQTEAYVCSMSATLVRIAARVFVTKEWNENHIQLITAEQML